MVIHDYYQILHVHQQANREIIKASYRTLMQKLKFHPDLGGDATEAALINEAYAVLSNPALRAKYDAACKKTPPITKSKATTYSSLHVTFSDTELPIKQCPFCHHTQTPVVSKGYNSNEHCSLCGSPISFRAAPESTTSKRDSIRINLQDDISLTPHKQSDKKYTVQIEDMSAIGISILSPHLLTPGDRVQLSNQSLSGVAEVVHCNKSTRPHRCGLKFLTVKHNKARGNFISASA